MLVCPQCGGHFEARIAPWKRQANVYISSTRPRKPGVCTNTLALPFAETDDDVLGIATMQDWDGARLSFTQKLTLAHHPETFWTLFEPGIRRLNWLRNQPAHDLERTVTAHDLAPIRGLMAPFFVIKREDTPYGAQLVEAFTQTTCQWLA